MSWSKFCKVFLRALFVLYCIEAGVLLALSPWRDVWPRLVVGLPWDAIRTTLMTSLGRSLITGFGLVHLVWGFHDLNQMLGGRSRKLENSASANALLPESQRRTP